MSLLGSIRDPVVHAVLVKFRPRFTPGGRVLWVSDNMKEPTYHSRHGLIRLGAWPSPLVNMPNVVIHYEKRGWLALVDAATIRGPMTAQRREAVERVFRRCNVGLVFVTAFKSRRDFAASPAEFTWHTEVWFAEEPNHLVHFDGGRLGGPSVA